MDSPAIESEHSPEKELLSIIQSFDPKVMTHAGRTTTAEILAEISATTTTTVTELPESGEQLPVQTPVSAADDDNTEETAATAVSAIMAPNLTTSRKSSATSVPTPDAGSMGSSVFAFDSLANWGPVHEYIVQLLQHKDQACTAFLKKTLHSRPKEIPALVNDDNRISYILWHACRWHILYSYCDIMFVLNPNVEKHLGGVISMHDMALQVAGNYRTCVEVPPEPEPIPTAAAAAAAAKAAAKPKQPPRSAELSKGDTVPPEPEPIPTAAAKAAAKPKQPPRSAELSKGDAVPPEPEPIPTAAANAAAKPKQPPHPVELSKGDEVAKVLQRLREINPHAVSDQLESRYQVNAESLMLLDLLALDEPERNEYILRRAYERRLLCVDEDSQQLAVHGRLHSSCWAPGFLAACQQNVAGIVEQAAAAAAAAAASAAASTATTGQSKPKPKPKQVAAAAAPAPAPAPAAAVTPAVVTGKNAKKKLAKLAKLPETPAVAEPPKAGQSANKAKSKAKDAALKSDLHEATKSMQRLMVDYAQQRPDCDEPLAVGSQRKRTVPGNTFAAPGGAAAQQRDSILVELNRILQRVQGDQAQLGVLSEPEEYAHFVRAFDRTVAQIAKRLHDEPIPAKTVLAPAKPKPAPISAAAAKPKPAPIAAATTTTKLTEPPATTTAATPKSPANFSDVLNQLTEYVTGSYNYRIAPFVPAPLDPTNVYADVRNLLVIDKFVAKLLAARLGRVVEGELRINAYNLVQGYVTSSDTADDTLIESILLRQCAMHGDLVRVFVFHHTARTQERSNPLGFVVRVREQLNDRCCLGHATPNKNRNYCMLQPTDRRVPPLRIPKSADRVLSDQMLYEAHIVGWTADGSAIGEIRRQIGERQLLSTSNEGILVSNHLRVTKFTDDILDALPGDDWQVPAEERARRTDLTAECVFTIDPATARDLDDALSVRRLADDTFEVGVHISDVTYFIAENSELDRLIRIQTTSIYLVNEVYHMLPRSLCMTCSLLPGHDKLAFSVFWRFSAAGEVLGEARIERTVIRSCAQLSYEHAQRMLDEPERDWSAAAGDELPAIGGGFTAGDLSERIGWLHRLARPLRARRFERKCLGINQPKITFRLDEAGEPVSWQRYQQIDSNWLIEEFMLLANQTVAKRVFEAYPDRALLRNHGPPKEQATKQLSDKLRLFDFHIDVQSPRSISESLYALINNAAIPRNVMAVLTEWVTRPMCRALYVSSAPIVAAIAEAKREADKRAAAARPNAGAAVVEAADGAAKEVVEPVDVAVAEADQLWHFALSIPIYTHFTSPIRRYPDVLVHRLLAGALKLGAKPAVAGQLLEDLAKACNEKKYGAKSAGEASTDLYFAHYVRKQGPVVMAAVVTDVMNVDMFEVMLVDTGAKLKIVVAKHKPAIQFNTNGNQKPLSGTLQFVAPRNGNNGQQPQAQPQQPGATSARLRIEVFRELQVSITVTDLNVLKASILPPSAQ